MSKKKNWLSWVLILAALLGPIVVGSFNRILDSRFATEKLFSIPSTPTEMPLTDCTPSLDPTVYEQLNTLTLNQENDLTISLRIAALFSADQAARQFPGSDPHQLNLDDTARRVEVLGYILNGQIHTGRDLVYAAFIFQHGDCSEHYQFANRLAQIAMDTGYEDARWIYAATLDRYLMSLGKPQKFGTQYTSVDGEFKLYPIDPTTTDAERAKYNIPPLSEIRNTKPADTNAGNGASIKHWLESWWLTLIGASFAILGVVICVIEVKPNPFLGKIILGIALAIFSLSIVGHYTQVNALAQGTYETQRKVWGSINILMIVVWLTFGCIEIIRWIRVKSAQQRAADQ
jgi:hypothetical protein